MKFVGSMFPKWLRLFLAFGFLGILFYFVGTADLITLFKNIELQYVLYLFLLSVVLIWISCVKWQLFLKASGHHAPILRLMKYYTTSYFFNLFMPSIIGGDVARSIQLGHELKNYKSVFAATFMERFTGFWAMTLMGLFFVLTGAQVTTGVEIAIILVAGITFLSAVVLFSKTLTELSFRVTISILRGLKFKKIASRLEPFFENVTEAMAFARNNMPLLFKALLLSFVFHIFAVVNTYVAALAIGWNTAEFSTLCVVVPLVLLVSVAPVTPSALGIQEGAFLYFLTRIGATHAQGLGVGLVLRAKNIVTALIGGLIWLITKNHTEQPSNKPKDNLHAVEC